MSDRKKSLRPGAGRPTREQAEQRHEELLDRALDLFLENGYELTTIDAVAVEVGMAKRTVYTLYEDKRALFLATVQRAIDRWTIPMEVLRALDGDDLESTLIAVGRVRLANSTDRAGLRLQRIINTESYRFPEIFTQTYERGTMPTINFLTEVLRRHVKAGTVKVAEPRMAAEAFLSMAVGGPIRGAVMGQAIDKSILEKRLRFCVKLFMDGIRA